MSEETKISEIAAAARVVTDGLLHQSANPLAREIVAEADAGRMSLRDLLFEPTYGPRLVGRIDAALDRLEKMPQSERQATEQAGACLMARLLRERGQS